MRYAKPEVLQIGPALETIQGEKGIPVQADLSGSQTDHRPTSAAYEADE